MNTATSLLSLATATAPVWLGDTQPVQGKPQFSYFYNGRTVYGYQSGRPWYFKAFPSLQPQKATLNAKQSPWCLKDGAATLVGLHAFAHGAVRRIGKYGHFYFIHNNTVYAPRKDDGEFRLHRLEHADAKSFKVLNELEAEDCHRKYRIGGLTEDDIAQRPAKPPLAPWFPTLNSSASDPQSKQQNLDALLAWFDDDFIAKWRRHRSNPAFYQHVRYALGLSYELRELNSAQHLRSALQVFEYIRPYAWVRPELFHDAALLYQALGDDTAASACEQTVHELLSAEPYLSASLIDAYQHARACALDDGSEHDDAFIAMLERRILYGWQFPSVEQLQLLKQCAADDSAQLQEATLLDEGCFALMQNQMCAQLQSEMPDPVRQRIYKSLELYHDHSYLTPLAWVRVADSLFWEAHHWAPWQEMFASQDRPLQTSAKLLRCTQLLEEFHRRIKGLSCNMRQHFQAEAGRYAVIKIMQLAGAAANDKG